MEGEPALVIVPGSHRTGPLHQESQWSPTSLVFFQMRSILSYFFVHRWNQFLKDFLLFLKCGYFPMKSPQNMSKQWVANDVGSIKSISLTKCAPMDVWQACEIFTRDFTFHTCTAISLPHQWGPSGQLWCVSYWLKTLKVRSELFNSQK